MSTTSGTFPAWMAPRVDPRRFAMVREVTDLPAHVTYRWRAVRPDGNAAWFVSEDAAFAWVTLK